MSCRLPLFRHPLPSFALWCLVALIWTVATPHAQPSPSVDQVSLNPARTLTQYVQDVWTVEDGLPQNSVGAVLRTQDGFLWVGTQEGLARFDGLRFELDYRGLPSSFVSALYEEADGTLWVGTYGGLVSYADGQFSDPIEGLPGNRISTLASDAAGTLWVGTYDGGLGRITGENVDAFTLADGMPEDAVMDLAVGSNGVVWIATRTAGLVRYDPTPGVQGRFTTFTSADGLPDASLTSLAFDPTGALWITTENGLSRYAGEHFTTFTTEDGLPLSDLRTILADDRGAVWLGGNDGGIARFYQGRFSALTPQTGFPDGTVRALHLDNEGNLWIGTDSGGLTRLRDDALVPYSTAEGLTDSYVWSVYEASDGALWVGTEGGLSRLYQNQFTTFTTEDGLPSNRLIAVRGTRDGAIWAGTHGDGLIRYAEGQFTIFTTEQGLPDLSIYALYEDLPGNLWLGTGGGLVRYTDSQFTTFTTDDGLSSNLITVIAEDTRGCLLVGTYEGGLNTLCDGTVVRQVTTDHGLPSDLVLSLYVDNAGVIWAGLLGGLARIEGDAVHTFTADDGLYSDEILQLFEDRSGNVWMSSNRGLFRVPKQALNAVAAGKAEMVESVPHGRATGQRTLEFNGGVQPAGWQSTNGTLWFPTTEGVIAVQPNDLQNRPIPTPHIEALFVGEESLALDGAVTLPAGDSRFYFRYVAPSFVAPERLRYRYQLEGIDAGWVEADHRREAFYTKIPPGTYTFRVQALGDGGRVSEVRSLTFERTPHFYQTVWFFALCLVLAVGLLYLIYVLRIRYLMARQRELAHLVEVRTEDLREANQRLTETSELKSQLMHMVAHDLKNPLNGVHEIAKLLRMELETEAPQQEFATLIEEAAEQMLAMVIRFLDAEALDSDTLNIDFQPVDLTAEVHAAAHRFQGAAERKEQRLTVEAHTEKSFVRADPAWLKEVFDNLVSNAVKFTPPGKRIWIGVEPAGDSVRFAVRDEGPGLTPDDLDRLFGKFQCLSAQPTGGESSSGLGLSIVQRVVELLGGQVWAENAPEGGSIFFVELPATDEAPAAAPASGEAPDEAFDEFDLGGVLLEG